MRDQVLKEAFALEVGSDMAVEDNLTVLESDIITASGKTVVGLKQSKAWSDEW